MSQHYLFCSAVVYGFFFPFVKMLRVVLVNRVSSVSSKQSRSDYTLGHRPGGRCVRNIQIKDLCTVSFFGTRTRIMLFMLFWLPVATTSTHVIMLSVKQIA